MKEVCKEIKSYSELNGRSETNLVDALNGAYNYGMTKSVINKHIHDKELTLFPFK
jgi:hypothetical protein